MSTEVKMRHSTNEALMRNAEHWQRTIGIITCKMLRERHKREEFDRITSLLASISFRRLVEKRDWHLAFTGGTFKDLRSTLEGQPELRGRIHGYAPSALGVIQLANLVIHGHLLAVLFFNDIEDIYADSPQNLCLRRICNHYNIPLLEDFTSIEFILHRWHDERLQPAAQGGTFPEDAIKAYFGDSVGGDIVLSKEDLSPENRLNQRSRETLAIISHNNMKMEMLNFCLKHMVKILAYRRVLTTGTTGERIIDQYRSALSVLRDNVGEDVFRSWTWTPKDGDIDRFINEKIQPFKSGPDGGDIQISAKVIEGTCHRVLFFQDPQTAHPHQFDIRMMEKVAQDHATAVLFATSIEMAELIV